VGNRRGKNSLRSNSLPLHPVPHLAARLSANGPPIVPGLPSKKQAAIRRGARPWRTGARRVQSWGLFPPDLPDNATPPTSIISTSTARRNLQRKARCARIHDDLPRSDRSHAPAWECSLGRSSAPS
jgi:hypothetical protein